MKFKTISLVLCGFLLISLAMGGSLLAQTETDVPGEDLPDVPRYPDIIRIYYFATETGEIVIYHGDADINVAEDFYKTSMQEGGWSLAVESHMAENEMPSGAIFNFMMDFVQLYEEAYAEGTMEDVFPATQTPTSSWIGGFQKGNVRAMITVFAIEGSSYVMISYLSSHPPSIPVPEIYQPSLSITENVSLDLLLEFKSTGRVRIKADYSGPNPLYSLYYLTVPVPAVVSLPVPSEQETSFAASFGSFTNDLIYKNPSQIDENLDTARPSVGDITFDITAYVGTTIVDPHTQKTTALRISGVVSAAERGGTIKIYVEGALVTSVLTDSATGKWSTSITLTEGTIQKVEVSLTDVAGNETLKKLYGYFLADATAPAITLGELPATTDNAVITVSGSVTKDAWETYADITVNIQIGLTRTTVPVLADGSWSLNVSLREGPNTITAWAIDPLDNPSDVKSASIERTVTPTPTIPAQPVSGEINWEINIELTSPSEGTLTLTANGWVVLPFTEEQKQMISMGVAAYKLAPGMLNQQLLQYISSSLSYPQYDLEITDLSITELDWDGAASKLTFGVTLTAESSMFGAELRRELPMSITTTGTGSIPTTITSIGDLGELTFDALLRVVTKTMVAELQMNFTGVTSTIGFDFEFELRTDNMGVVTRTDNMIVVDFGGLRGYLPAQTAVPDQPAYENVTFMLRVPSGAEVEDLPSGYTQTDFTYTWTGSSAINAILALVTGEAGTRISYWVGPATVAIENIQSSVGQTIEVENNYIESVEIESERAIVVNFEKDQPVRKLRVALATAIENLDVQAQRLPERPAGVAEPTAEKVIVYHYLEVSTSALEEVESATLEFRVSKLWISVNNIDQSTVRLLRYQDGGWVELETVKVGDDENNVYFEATTPGFSLFAITGEVGGEAPSPVLLILLVVIAASAGVAGAAAALWIKSRRRPPRLKRAKRTAKRRKKGKRRAP